MVREGLLPMRAVVQLTGLSSDTLRIWERRHRAVVPQRINSHRLYSDQDIHRLQLLKRAVDHGHSISQIARLSNEKLEKLPLTNAPQLDESAQHNQFEREVATLVGYLQNYQIDLLEESLGKLASFLMPGPFVHQVVLPLLREVGLAWSKGQLNVAQEHILSFSLRRILSTLAAMQYRERTQTPIIFATPSGQLHEFGILAGAMLATAYGFPVLYVGASVPLEDLIQAWRKTKSSCLVLGLYETYHDAGMLEEARNLAQSTPGLTRLIGGHYSKKLGHELNQMGYESVESLADLEKRLLHLRRSHSA